jgi:RecA-family ATPase
MNNQSTTGKLSAEQLKADASGWQFYAKQPVARDNSLRIRPINQWITEASNEPVPHMLFGKFWYQGELCIMFSDSNAGKSVLAIQIGNSISCGKGIYPFELETEGQPVLYCDFELNSKQLEARYSHEWQMHYNFNDNFYRADLNPDLELPEGFDTNEDYFNYSLEQGVMSTGARVIIIDNITYMRSETEQAKDALSLMKQLKALKNKYNLSILVLAHTPKRDPSKPISSNDLQGSKMLMNFCDSAFAIGKSTQHADKRYLKQIKQRNTSQVYGQNNVCLFNITKPHNFLQFDFDDYGDERAHLKEPKDIEKEELTEKALELRTKGLSLRDTATTLGISYQKVDRLLRSVDKRARVSTEA